MLDSRRLGERFCRLGIKIHSRIKNLRHISISGQDEVTRGYEVAHEKKNFIK